MGLDINRFPDEVDEEFKCSICLNVLERPVHGSCGHLFCLTCISVWLESSSSHGYGSPLSSSVGSRLSRRGLTVGTCPVDRKELRKEDLVEVALPFRAFLFRLNIKCDYEPFGCKAVVPFGSLKDHVRDCNFNPDEQVECQNGCKCVLPRKYLIKENHNCLKELKKIIRRQERYIQRLEDDSQMYQLGLRQKRRWMFWASLVMIVIGIMVLFSNDEAKQLLKV